MIFRELFLLTFGGLSDIIKLYYNKKEQIYGKIFYINADIQSETA